LTSSSAFSLARRLRAGEPVFCGWSVLGAPIVSETLAREGFSAVAIDMQHGLWDVAAAADAIAAIHHAGAAPLLRVPAGDYAMASRALDFGAQGVIAPMIDSAADARAFVGAAKYPPLGGRSWGPMRATMLTGIDQKYYLQAANALTVTFAMIESRAALDNLDAIARTDGIDGLFLGPSDLSIALSQGDYLDPHAKEVEDGLDQMAAAARKAGKIAGAYCRNAERALALKKRGISFLAIGSDLNLLRAGIAAEMKILKS
jgi:4-hydroxy-2-oxoheptanedioate aldolase